MHYRYVNQSSLDNKARSKPLPVRLIRARVEPGMWRRCSSGFDGIGSVGDFSVGFDFSDSDSDSDLAISPRRFRVPIWCSVLFLVSIPNTPLFFRGDSQIVERIYSLSVSYCHPCAASCW